MNSNSPASSVRIKPAEAALLVIDVQQSLFRKPAPIYRAEMFLANINILIDLAHRARVPVFYIQHSNKMLVEGTDEWQLHPRLQLAAGDRTVHKHHGSAFKGTRLHQELSQANIRTLIVTGLVTHGCVKATCWEARKLGYRVILVADGHSNYHRQAADLIDKWHQNFRAEGIELRPTAEIDFCG